MANNHIYNDGDSKVKITLTFPTNKTWTSYSYVHIEMKNKRTGELLQTSGYPSGQGDNDLYVPSLTGSDCYMKIDKSNITGKFGIIEWVVKSKEADTVYDDNQYEPVDKLTKLILK